MFYLIGGVPLGLLWAVLQFYLCKKEYKNIIKFLPALSSAALFIFAEVIRGENLLADAVYGMFGMGIFAAVVLLWILGASLATGAAIGWAVYLIVCKNHKCE